MVIAIFDSTTDSITLPAFHLLPLFATRHTSTYHVTTPQNLLTANYNYYPLDWAATKEATMVYEGKYVYGSLLDCEEVYSITSIRVWRGHLESHGRPPK